jgi:hypothetical protein
MADKITICNNALGEISAPFIVSLDENSISAENCRRLYDIVVSDILEGDDFAPAVRRAKLALATNDRLLEWEYCYAAPADMATAVALYQFDATVTTARDMPVVGPYSFPTQHAYGEIPFIHVESRIYTNLEDAVLEYTVSAINPEAMAPLLRRAVELELAARLAMPIKKDKEIRDNLRRMANAAMQYAVADNRNRQPTMKTRRVTEVEYARAGYVEQLV